MLPYYSYNQKNLDRPSKNNLVVKQAGNDKLQNDIVNLITSRDATITKEEAISLLENYASTIEMLVKTNNSMHTPLHNSLSRISRSLQENSFPDLRKTLGITSQELVEAKESDTGFVTGKPVTLKPVINRCHNVVSNSRVVMSGSVVQLYGSSLYFDRTDSKQGVFMIDTEGFTVRATTLVRMKADNIIFMIPGGIAAGEYKLEVRNLCLETGQIHIGSLPGLLTVVI